ncbi:MAG: rSAM/selenodomain-associated transferase 1 [Glaciecola sp.]|jgi:rSAM/selenodomain-associated transferase 1
MDNQLVIFAKNPVLGKVKTRLAATVGNEKALEVYKELLSYTCNISCKVNAEKTVFYSDIIEESDLWDKAGFNQAIQLGENLGQRMFTALKNTLKDNKVVIIGTDCKELTSDIVDQAFKALDFVDVVIGPALDGGYYLIGMKSLEENLFTDIPWSTSGVLEQTVSKMNKNQLSFLLLKTLSDIDTEEDLNRS